MLNINSSKKKMLAAILCLVMIVTSIQVPKRVIYAEGAESLSDYVEDVVVKKNAVDVTKETSIQLTDGDSLKVTYDINIPKGKVATGSAITMDIPEKMIPKIDTTTGIKSPYAVTVSGSAIVLTHEDVDNGESSEGDVSEDTIEGSFVVDYALDLNAVEKDVSFSFDVETKEGTKRYQITYAPKQTIDFITNVQLLIDDDTPIGDTRVDKDSSVIVHYDFSCASGQSLADLGEFSVALPNEINVTGNFTKTLSTEPNDGGVQLCVASVSKENRNVTFTFNEAISSMYDIEGEFEFELKFNKSAIGKVDYKVITFETGNNNIDIGVYFNNPDVIPKIEKSYTKQENHEYSWTTTVTGGNTVAGGATIVEIIHNQELIEGSVAFNGNTLDKTQYELVKVSGEENKWKLSYYISDFGDYDEETDFILTYKTRILDSVYAGGIETTLTNTSSLYDGSKLIDSADVKAGEIIVTPKCFEQSVVINLKAKLATWTFKVNSDEIDMEDPWFEWEIIDKYLVMQDDSFTITSADGTKTYTKAELSTWYVDAEGCYTFDGLKDSSNILNKAVTISFNTTITEDFFKENRPGYEFEVSAFMTWLQPITGGGSGTRIRQGKPENQKQTISYSVVKKQSLEYDESTGMILWEISLNSDTVADAINLSDVVITDIIGDDQTFVSESVKYADDTDTKPTSVSEGKTEENKAYYEVVKDGEKENVVIHFPSVTTSRRVYIQTKVSDSIIYHNVDGEKKVVGNSITVEATGIEGTQTVDDATRKIDSKIIRKESSYDESSHTITWKVHINESGLPIENPVFSDVITKSEIQKYKAGSFEVTKGSEVIVDKDDALDDDKLNSSEPTLVYDFADAKDEKGKINDYYVITYKTYIYNDEDFYENTTISIENTAVLAGTATLDLEKTPFTESAKKIEEVTVSVVTKEAVFEDNQYMIRWRITVNRDGLKLHNATITDCFAGLEGDLEFDATDMTLIKGERVEGKWRVDANTKAWVGTEIAISKDDFKYDTKTKTLVFNLPENSTDAYQLSFTTKIKNKTLKKIKCQNEAIYKNNSGEIEITSQKSMAVANMTLPSGAISGKGKSGTLIIKKYITGTTIPLEGTEFALYDKFGTQVGSIKKTDAQGKVVFEDLTVDGKYTIKEIKPTEGYQINNDIFETTSSTEPIKDNEFIATDGTIEIYSYAELLKTNISFKKVKEVATGDGLQGATFKLYKTNDANETTIETAISDKDGIVTFENIAFGEYTIAETSAPTGYKLSTSIITVTMSVVEPEKGETLYTAKANLSSETYINTTMPGSIEVVLTDADETDKAIEGATFEVYDSNDTCIKEFTTDSYGECDVTGLPLGTYTVKQTEAANGYIKSDETKSTLLELTDRDKVVKFKNDRIKADIKFTVKVDDAEKTPLENVRYELYAKDDDNCSNLIKYIDSTKDGVVCFTDVPYGEYKIIQTDVPAGYEKTNEVISVAITDDIKTLTETIEPEIESSKSNTQYLRICPGSIKVILTDEETSEPIEGAKFAVYDAKNKLVDIFETD
ncbi:SpaA isopeptide-forming pilin-related protein, partial [Anaerosporobacter sp.]|uniref:SpaA isopeptide-forming pilin-related protein n=1 Tax=Anaerosporobacter sp. TaxID=1872529 RepID=UPI00286F107B